MKDFEKMNLYDLKDPEKVEHHTKRKEVGAQFFKDASWRRALKRFTYVAQKLQYVDHWTDAEAKAKAIQLRRVSNLNAAAVHLKLANWREACSCCDAVLKEESENVKALFRRGHAFSELAEYREANQDLRKVLELDKENKEAARLLSKVKQHMKSEVANEKKMFSKMVSGSPTEKETSSGNASKVVKGEPAKPTEESVESDDGAGDSCFYTLGATLMVAGAFYALVWPKLRKLF